MKITFIPPTEEFEKFIDPPEPASKLIPKWYKDSPRFDEKEVGFATNNMLTNFTLKQCMPFFDTLTTGYIHKTWTDIYVEKRDDDSIVLRQKNGPKIIGQRPHASVPIPETYYQEEFVWQTGWTPKTPKGYSCIVTSPFNRTDLPFFTATGIVDSDDFYHIHQGNFPFFIRKGFHGFIPKGTPMYQIIPFKRDEWKMEVEKFSEQDNEKRSRVLTSMYYGAYKKLFWKKKSFK